MHTHISMKSCFLRAPKWEALNTHRDFYLSSDYSNVQITSKSSTSISSYSVIYPRI